MPGSRPVYLSVAFGKKERAQEGSFAGGFGDFGEKDGTEDSDKQNE